MDVEYPDALGGNECVEVTRVASNKDCPVAVITSRSLSFDLKANTTKTLKWRRSSASNDILDPNGGNVESQGVTNVTLADMVLSSSVVFEVYDDQGKIRLRFRLKHF